MDADDEKIKVAYRRLAKFYHLDCLFLIFICLLMSFNFLKHSLLESLNLVFYLELIHAFSVLSL